jgi:hypothetical protein
LHKGHNQWFLIEIFGHKPPCRLDFAYCKASIIQTDNEKDSDGNQNTVEPITETLQKESAQVDLKNEKESIFLVIHGGMDTEGNVFDDFFLINLI